MVGATFEGIFCMHDICLDMLTPMLYIFVWPKRWGAIRDKGFAHVPIVEFKALDQVTAYVLLMVCLTKRSMGALPFSWGM